MTTMLELADEICNDPRIFTRDWNHSLDGLKLVIVEKLALRQAAPGGGERIAELETQLECALAGEATWKSCAESWQEAADSGGAVVDKVRTKLVYIKRWRTIIRVPECYADEIVAALQLSALPQEAPAQAQAARESLDYELRVLRSALQEISRLAPEERVIPLDRAFATVREMAAIARNALGATIE